MSRKNEAANAKPMLGDVYRCYIELDDEYRLWYGTHRNHNMNFQKNIIPKSSKNLTSPKKN